MGTARSMLLLAPPKAVAAGLTSCGINGGAHAKVDIGMQKNRRSREVAQAHEGKEGSRENGPKL